MFALILALALGGTYKECRVVSGSIWTCDAVSYNGSAVIQHNGLIRSCKIANGRVQSCGGSYQGTAPARQGGYWKACKIANGRVFSCGANHNGHVVVRR
jgi:hypothetical protein